MTGTMGFWKQFFGGGTEEEDENTAGASGLPEELASDDWESYPYTTVESFPEYMKGHKFFVLYCPEEGSAHDHRKDGYRPQNGQL